MNSFKFLILICFILTLPIVSAKEATFESSDGYSDSEKESYSLILEKVASITRSKAKRTQTDFTAINLPFAAFDHFIFCTEQNLNFQRQHFTSTLHKTTHARAPPVVV